MTVHESGRPARSADTRSCDALDHASIDTSGVSEKRIGRSTKKAVTTAALSPQVHTTSPGAPNLIKTITTTAPMTVADAHLADVRLMSRLTRCL
jgi:hypothetical protein